MNIRPHRREIFRQLGAQSGDQSIAVLRRAGDNDELRIVCRRKLGIRRQNEARRAGADIIGIIVDFVPLRFEIAGQSLRLRLARLERRAFRQAHFEEDLGTQGRREKFLPYGREKENGGDEYDQRPRKDENAVGEEPA